MLPVFCRCWTVFALITCLSRASGSYCTTLCPGFDNKDDCCDDDGFPNMDMSTFIIGVFSLIGVVSVIVITCLFCPCCVLHKRRKNGTIYRRFGGADPPNGQRKKGNFKRGFKKTNTSTVSVNGTPSVTIIANYPVQENFPQPYAPGQMMGQTLSNHRPQPQSVPFPTEVQSPAPCTVAVICDSQGRQPAFNPMYRQ